MAQSGFDRTNPAHVQRLNVAIGVITNKIVNTKIGIVSDVINSGRTIEERTILNNTHNITNDSDYDILRLSFANVNDRLKAIRNEELRVYRELWYISCFVQDCLCLRNMLISFLVWTKKTVIDAEREFYLRLTVFDDERLLYTIYENWQLLGDIMYQLFKFEHEQEFLTWYSKYDLMFMKENQIYGE